MDAVEAWVLHHRDLTESYSLLKPYGDSRGTPGQQLFVRLLGHGHTGASRHREHSSCCLIWELAWAGLVQTAAPGLELEAGSRD
jgi:hypothetical protein